MIIDQLFNEHMPLRISDKGSAPESIFCILKDKPVAKRMIGVDCNLISGRTNQCPKPAAHGLNCRSGISQAKNVGRIDILLFKDLTNSDGQDLRFSGTRTSKHQHRTFRLKNRFLLSGVQFIESLLVFVDCWAMNN